MDVSNNYITMCDMAQEIQDGYKPSAGDFAVRACEYGHYTIGLVSWNYSEWCLWWSLLDGTDGIILRGSNSQERYLDRLIWIPRQDQLQDMITGDLYGWPVSGIDNIDRLEFFNDFARDLNNSRTMSMEQLWLAFVMKEKYGKVWNNECWEVSK